MAQIGHGFYAGIPDWATRLANSGWQLVADPPANNPLPGAKIIGRAMPPGLDGWEWGCVMRGEAGLEEYVQFCLPHWQRARYVEAWTGPNEPLANTVDDAVALAEWSRELILTAKTFGVKIVAGCFSRGRPDENILPYYRPMLEALARHGGYLGVHEYGQRQGMDYGPDLGWHCLRYRRWLPLVKELGVKLICTELGIADPATNTGYAAWDISQGELARQVAWWARETQGDPAMVAGIMFCATGYGWGSFTYGEDFARRLVEINGSLVPAPSPQPVPVPQPVPEPAPPSALVLPRLLWPLANGAGHITQEFGEDKVDYSRFGLIHHNGRDIGAPKGTPVVATHAGQAWCYQDAGYGNTVEVWAPSIAKASAYKTISAHLDRILVPDRRYVRAGEVIGYVGSTGNSTGPHLHFGIKLLQGKNNGYRDWVDPRPFMGR